jgi:Xaa-Pro dipeptidase
LKRQNAAKLGVWRGFGAKKRAQRRSKIAAHEFLNRLLDFIMTHYALVRYTDGMSTYQKRREKIAGWMRQNNIALLVVEDFEARRDPALRWLSGHPMDALLFLAANGESLLVPWDKHLAAAYSQVDKVLPYTEIGRDMITAIKTAIERFGIAAGSAIEIPARTTYPVWTRLSRDLQGFTLLCRDDGVNEILNNGRAVKDADEIAIYRMVSKITSNMIDELEDAVKKGQLRTETDVALFIEREARLRDCDGTGFETLCAGPGRSFGIHCFPASTGAEFAAAGLSILDFGLVYRGYTSDVTLTFARGPLSAAQKEMLALTEKAAALGVSMVKPGVYCRDIGKAVDAFFKEHGREMPHNLGHGIGLEAHEAPSLSSKDDNKWRLEPGMIVTVEPGLYDAEAGGCRLENDVLVTETGGETLTNSRFIFL